MAGASVAWPAAHTARLVSSLRRALTLVGLQFEECLAKELEQIQNAKEPFLKNFSHDDYDALVNGWKVPTLKALLAGVGVCGWQTAVQLQVTTPRLAKPSTTPSVMIVFTWWFRAFVCACLTHQGELAASSVVAACSLDQPVFIPTWLH